MIKKLALPISVAAIIVLIAVGCGGDSDAANSSTASESSAVSKTNEGGSEAGDGAGAPAGNAGGTIAKAEFVKQANAICARRKTAAFNGVDTYVRERQGGGQSPSELSAEAVYAVFLPETEKMIDEVRELGAPPGDKAQVDAYLAGMEEAVAISKEKEFTADSVDSYGADSFGREFVQPSKLANKYGLAECSYL